MEVKLVQQGEKKDMMAVVVIELLEGKHERQAEAAFLCQLEQWWLRCGHGGI